VSSKSQGTENRRSAVWGSLVVILLILVIIFLIGYFAWWSPMQRKSAPNSLRDKAIFYPSSRITWSALVMDSKNRL
jgi:flagellar basal body-associated protein FliL